MPHSQLKRVTVYLNGYLAKNPDGKLLMSIPESKGLKAFYERVRSGQDGRKKIAIVAVARKLLSIMRAIMLTGELFNEQLVTAAIGQAA